MSFSLYSATVPSFLQIIGSVDRLLDKAEAWCGEHGVVAADLIQSRLAPDMLPFAYQVKSCAEHSIGAIEGIRLGVVSPSLEAPPDSFAGLHAKLAGARAALEALEPAEINAFVGRPVRWEFKSTRMNFMAETFLVSYAQPNFYFHATTAYDILRHRGLAIGKMDFMGKVQVLG